MLPTEAVTVRQHNPFVCLHLAKGAESGAFSPSLVGEGTVLINIGVCHRFAFRLDF